MLGAARAALDDEDREAVVADEAHGGDAGRGAAAGDDEIVAALGHGCSSAELGVVFEEDRLAVRGGVGGAVPGGGQGIDLGGIGNLLVA